VFPLVNVEEIQEVARSLGFDLSREQAESFRGPVVAQLEMLDQFVQGHGDETAPVLVSPDRNQGYRPGPEEDPYNAWRWRCEIRGLDSGSLAGKTVSFKDNMAVAGLPMTFNTMALAGLIPDVDATIVTRVLQAGGIVVGKNSHDGFTGMPSSGSASGDYGRVINPHGTSRLTGGSSSGGGAAVAAGEVDIAFGGDQTGSVRIPAAWCGVVGIKPTFGLVSQFATGFGSDPSLDHVGPMARNVEDVAAALEAVAGPDGLDPRQGRDVPEHLDATSKLYDGVAGLRIGLLNEGFVDPIQPEVRDAVLAAADVLASAGAKVTRISVPRHFDMAPYFALFGEGGLAIERTTFFGAGARTYYPTSIVVAMNEFIANHGDQLWPLPQLTRIVSELSRRNYYGAVYTKAQNARPSFIRAYDCALGEVDVLMMPTCISVAPECPPISDRLTSLESDLSILASPPNARTVSEVSIGVRAIRNTGQFNYSGHPALSVPCGKADGLPVAFQLVGRFYQDPLLLRTAAAYAAAVDWETLVAVPPHR
jgi:amidase